MVKSSGWSSAPPKFYPLYPFSAGRNFLPALFMIVLFCFLAFFNLFCKLCYFNMHISFVYTTVFQVYILSSPDKSPSLFDISQCWIGYMC